MTIEFTPWPKTPRLNRDMIITEKIDGTNAAVIFHLADGYLVDDPNLITAFNDENGNLVSVFAQSRRQLITPQQDNFGFASWVRDNAETLYADLGEGVHFGEWWGHGIQRGYGLAKGERYFSLFNVGRYSANRDPQPGQMQGPFTTPNLRLVPVLYIGPFDTEMVNGWVGYLREYGSSITETASFGFAEGVVVYHTAANMVFKATIENDEKPKGSTE